MKFIGGVLLLVVIGYVLLHFLALPLVAKRARDQKKLNANAGAVLDATFTGQPTATYRVRKDGASLSPKTVVDGGALRGYALNNTVDDDTGVLLVFTKTT